MQWLAWVQSTSFARWVAVSPSLWAYPSILTAHTLGLGILVGANVVLDLRLLGFFRGSPLRPFQRLFPLMWWGLWVNAVSGACLFVADATTKATQTIFWVKLLLVGSGVVIMAVTRHQVFPAVDGEGDVPARGRALAGASIVCWAGAITAGRLMAYIK